ncbi:MAG: ABC transporter substrate-binding protein [Desulfamplus sp.]|nr:ABC transporter substrate-binding protein [Desulfamplus sp.]
MKRAFFLVFLFCILAGEALSGIVKPETKDSHQILEKDSHQLEGKNFHRVVSLGPLITDMIYLLEADQRLSGVTSYCIIPEGKEKKQIIGTVIHMNIEKIVSLKPDAVFASTLTRAKQMEALKKQGINVIKFHNPVNFEEICAMFLSLGNSLGKRELALDIINKTSAQVKDIEKKAQRFEKRKVFIQIGIKPIRTSERGTFISNYILAE